MPAHPAFALQEQSSEAAAKATLALTEHVMRVEEQYLAQFFPYIAEDQEVAGAFAAVMDLILRLPLHSPDRVEALRRLLDCKFAFRRAQTCSPAK